MTNLKKKMKFLKKNKKMTYIELFKKHLILYSKSGCGPDLNPLGVGPLLPASSLPFQLNKSWQKMKRGTICLRQF